MLRVLTTAMLALVTASVAACATTASTTPRSRVAQDLGCTTEGTEVREIGPVAGEQAAARWQVTGCGRTAVYICTTPVRDCWREGAISPQADATYAP